MKRFTAVLLVSVSLVSAPSWAEQSPSQEILQEVRALVKRMDQIELADKEIKSKLDTLEGQLDRLEIKVHKS